MAEGIRSGAAGGPQESPQESSGGLLLRLDLGGPGDVTKARRRREHRFALGSSEAGLAQDGISGARALALFRRHGEASWIMAPHGAVLPALLAAIPQAEGPVALAISAPGPSPLLSAILGNLPEALDLVSVSLPSGCEAELREMAEALTEGVRERLPFVDVRAGEKRARLTLRNRPTEPPKAPAQPEKGRETGPARRPAPRAAAAGPAAWKMEFVRARLVGDEIEGALHAPDDAGEICVVAMDGERPVAIARPAPAPDDAARLVFRIELPRSLLIHSGAEAVTLRLGLPGTEGPAMRIELPPRRNISADVVLDAQVADMGPRPEARAPLGIALFAFDRIRWALAVVESLRHQGALPLVTVWMDGDQGRHDLRRKLDLAEDRLRAAGLSDIRRHRGNLGFRKLFIQALLHMTERYERVIMLEDDCFPTAFAIEELTRTLDRHEGDPDVLTTYGHHFGMDCERPLCPRFQGWGCATWSDKFRPRLMELAYLYSLPEDAFTDWAREMMTPEILERIDCTAPRAASATLRNFFAWDEALALVSALHGQMHAPTDRRCIYNFGVGPGSTHFTQVDWYRAPPFNMITQDEIWNHFGAPKPGNDGDG